MDWFQALAQPSSDNQDEPATQQAADVISTGVAGAPLSQDKKPLGGRVVHYGFGAMLGVAYGVAAEVVPQVTVGAGTAFATGTWAVIDEVVVPAAGLGSAPWRSPPESQAFGFASHIVFGLAAEMTRRAARHAIAG